MPPMHTTPVVIAKRCVSRWMATAQAWPARSVLPMTVKLPTKDKNHPMREVHEYEDVREFPMEDNLDLTAHYHAKEDDTVKCAETFI